MTTQNILPADSHDNVIPFPGMSKPAPTFDHELYVARITRAVEKMSSDDPKTFEAIAHIVATSGYNVDAMVQS